MDKAWLDAVEKDPYATSAQNPLLQ